MKKKLLSTVFVSSLSAVMFSANAEDNGTKYSYQHEKSSVTGSSYTANLYPEVNCYDRHSTYKQVGIQHEIGPPLIFRKRMKDRGVTLKYMELIQNGNKKGGCFIEENGKVLLIIEDGQAVKLSSNKFSQVK